MCIRDRLASDIKRNLERPIDELKLDISVEDRTGDTKQSIKKKQRVTPPNILLTTPESLALLISYPEAPRIFSNLKRIIVDEIHSITESKRGDQLFLAISNLRKYCLDAKIIGLSATVSDPSLIAGWLAPESDCEIILSDPGLEPNVSILKTSEPPPWAGSGGLYSIPEVIEEIAKHKTTLIFHNTRAQAEIFFHNLWLENNKNLQHSIYESTFELWNFCKKELLSGENDQIILDEIFLAIEMKIIDRDDLISTLENRFISGDVILTGTSIPKNFLLMADQITELRS